MEQKRLSYAPTIKLLAEHNVREGFAEPREIATVVAHLPRYLRTFTHFGYLCGWRKGELKTLEWSHVDPLNRRITLRRQHSKTEEPRMLALMGELWEIVEEQWAAREYRTPDGQTALSRHGVPPEWASRR